MAVQPSEFVSPPLSDSPTRVGLYKSHRPGLLKSDAPGFPGGAVVKNPPANAGDTGSSPGPGRSHIKKKKKKSDAPRS